MSMRWPRALRGSSTQTRKPMVVAIDSGALYDAMAGVLLRAGVPVFRSVDRALRAVNAWVAQD